MTNKKISFVDIYAQYQSIKEEIDAAIQSVIKDSAYIKGHYVETFEKEFAEYLGISFCVACANGTDAIEIALRALGIGVGDEVIVPVNTWISTAEAVTTAGATVVFVDNHPTRYTMDVTKIEEKVTSKTKAIIPVHLYGLPADMDEIIGIAQKYNLKIIEDCAQAHGATYKGRTVGTFGVAATFSFFPGKNLGAYGDAGAMVTHDSDLARHMRMITDHGRLGKFDHGLEGRNSRLDGLQAAVLSVKLRHLRDWTKARQQRAKLYDRFLSSVNIPKPITPEGYEHVFHLYVVQVPEREKVQDFLSSKGIATGIHYPTALHLATAYRYKNHTAEDFPVAAAAMNRVLSLPIYAELLEEDVAYISSSLADALHSL